MTEPTPRVEGFQSGIVRVRGEVRVMSNGSHGGPVTKALKDKERATTPQQGARQGAEEEAVEQIGRTINVQTVFLGVIAGILVLYTLYVTRTVAIPIVLACMLNLVLTPLVLALARMRIPEPIGAVLVVVPFLLLFGLGLSTLAEPAAGWLRRLPFVIDQLSDRLDFLRVPAEQLRQAEEALGNVGAEEETVEDVTQVVVARQTTLRDVLLNETTRFTVGAVATLVLLYFMLAMGDKFLRHLVSALPDFRTKKQAVEIAHQLQSDMSHYLLTITGINVAFGGVVAGAMFATGMPNPLLWGAMAGLLNYVPFLGHTVSAIVIGMVALLSLPDVTTALIPPAIFIVIAALEGNVITPMIVARRLTLNPVAVVTALLIWGWMWGIVGFLLAVPLLVVMKIACDQIEPLKPVGEFLGS
ncbi:AI-2E family transporter [Dongia deserti]|uniref:AI-2E family transporter n=1 Tax=Dongia deserti TaxID=2268030 RepID=UPI000E64DAC3|nr:AI-2E family transporter [Dongia deserti]